mmetsp:Transcript_23933/g.39160  ORF Transcript_23933/g.39160 Transcript_23933/m.39160 type:complete len:81 (+) Transcript_23933:713-955(+)
MENRMSTGVIAKSAAQIKLPVGTRQKGRGNLNLQVKQTLKRQRAQSKQEEMLGVSNRRKQRQQRRGGNHSSCAAGGGAKL